MYGKGWEWMVQFLTMKGFDVSIEFDENKAVDRKARECAALGAQIMEEMDRSVAKSNKERYVGKTCWWCSYYDQLDELMGECALLPPTIVVGKFDEDVQHVRSCRPIITLDAAACSKYKEIPHG